MNRSRQQATRTKGTSTVELAICLPVLMVLVFGALECTTMIFVKQSLHVASYEAARVAVRPSATNADAEKRSNLVIEERDLDDATVTFEPEDISAAAVGDKIVVTVSVPAESNSLLPLKFFNGNLSAATTMYKE